jgi:hypothetical protein
VVEFAGNHTVAYQPRRRPKAFRYACNSLADFPAVNWRAAASRKSQQEAIMMQS